MTNNQAPVNWEWVLAFVLVAAVACAAIIRLAYDFWAMVLLP